MSRSKAAVKALAVAAAVAMPVGLALPAYASTASGCTVTPKKPVFAGFNDNGVKLVDYRIDVTCSSGRTVDIIQQRYEQDWPDADDLLGTTRFSEDFTGSGGSLTLSNVRTLPDTDALDSYEEVYQQVHFRCGAVTG